MRSGFSLGRIFGIQITVDPSWLFIFVLVVWQLAVGVFPAWHPTWGSTLDWSVAIVAALLFFASVLAHELAHSVVAMAKGLSVRRITLFLFGGVSNIQREPPSPGAEFQIAIVGPVTSLILGLLFVLLGGVSAHAVQGTVMNPTHIFTAMGPVSTLLMWLGQINIILGLFNLIPGFPLDGGRVLRSLLWAVTKNLRRATQWAAGVGHGVAWLFILCGLSMLFGVRLPFFGAGLLNGLWLVFIGWFLNNATTLSYQQVLLQDVLEGIPVSRLMRAPIRTVPPDLPVSALVDTYLMGADERAYPVMQNAQLVGLVSLEDVHKVPRAAWDTTTVTQIMTPADALEVITPEDDAASSVMKLAERDFNQMPVVENGHLAGMLRRQDIVKWLQLHSQGV